MSTHYDTLEQISELLHRSPRAIHALTAARRIPFRRIAGTRRCLFLEDEVLAWVDAGGALPLEVIETDGGGVVVRPTP